MTSLSEALPRGIMLLGCGKMGGAMLEGWLTQGLAASKVTVIDVAPSDRVQALARDAGLVVNPDAIPDADVCLLAVKPQMMEEAIGAVAGMGAGTLYVSIAAGLTIDWFQARLGASARIVRSMPNTPAAVGKGISALVANEAAGAAGLEAAEALLAAIGATVRLESEAQMDAVTGLSGSGPAYVFHLIEAMAAAGEAEGLAPDLAMALARATVIGAGALAEAAEESAAQLRIDVTSPKGTTAEGLAVLMEALPDLMRRTVGAAANRSRELAG
ncbi:MAG: pyrroline-5-carboxylate reductase [Pseudomonadota bacterium]